MRDCSLASVLTCAAMALGLATPAHAEPTEGKVEAFSSWQARGQMYPTGPNEATFVGVLSGVLYVKGGDGSLDAGLIACPGTLVIQTGDGSQAGTGKCVIATPDGDRVYGEFQCSGEYLAGCNGDFKLTGGTGEKENISGGGPIQFRSAFARLAATVPGAMVEQSSVGLALWPELTYKLP